MIKQRPWQRRDDEPDLLERYVADDLDLGHAATMERYIEVWKHEYTKNLFPLDLETHMRRRFGRPGRK